MLSHKEEEKKQLACFFWETFNLLAVCFSFFFATSLIFEKMGLLCAKSLAPKRPLIVHFDLNGTVMREKDESLEKTFAKNLFGWTDEQNEWHMNPGEAKYVQTPGTVSYYHYLHETHDKKDVDEQVARMFLAPIPPDIHNYLTRMVENQSLMIFPSFYHFVNRYPKAKIVLRSFGPDLGKFINELKIRYPQMVFTRCKVEGKTGELHLLDTGGSVIKQIPPSQIVEWINQHPFHLAIREDYDWWKNGSGAGKCLWYNPTCEQYMFDDRKDAVYLENPIAQKLAGEFQHTNTILAACKSNYFVKLIEPLPAKRWCC